MAAAGAGLVSFQQMAKTNWIFSRARVGGKVCSDTMGFSVAVEGRKL